MSPFLLSVREALSPRRGRPYLQIKWVFPAGPSSTSPVPLHMHTVDNNVIYGVHMER